MTLSLSHLHYTFCFILAAAKLLAGSVFPLVRGGNAERAESCVVAISYSRSVWILALELHFGLVWISDYGLDLFYLDLVY